MSDLLDADTEEPTKYYVVRESCDYEWRAAEVERQSEAWRQKAEAARKEVYGS